MEDYKRLFLNKTRLSSAENILQSSARCQNCSPFSFYYEPLRKFCSEIHDPTLNFCSVREFCKCISDLRGEITRNCHLLKSKVNVLIAMLLRSHYFQFLFFTESSTSSAIPNSVPKFLDSLCNSSGYRRACCQSSKTFPGKLKLSRVFRGSPTSRLGFLEREVIRA